MKGEGRRMKEKKSPTTMKKEVQREDNMSFDDILEQKADDAIDEALDKMVDDNFSDESKVDAVEGLVETARDLLDEDDSIEDGDKRIIETLLDMYEGVIGDIKGG
jgi:hypothetical protein